MANDDGMQIASTHAALDVLEAALISTTSSTSLQFGSTHDIYFGATISLTVATGLLFSNGTNVIGASQGDATQYFRGVSQSYDPATGALTILITDAGSTSGTYTDWVLFAQDGPNANLIIATSTTNFTAIVGANTFTIQTGLNINLWDFVWVFAADGTATKFGGQITAYNSGTGVITVAWSTGTSFLAHSAWVVYRSSPRLLAAFGDFAKAGLQIQDLSSGSSGIFSYDSGSGSAPQRTITFLSHNGDRSIDLSGNLTVSAAATVSGTNTGDQDLTTANGKGWILLNTLTASTSSTLDDTTSITSTYNTYALVFEDIILSGANDFVMRISEDAGASYKTTTYANGGGFFVNAGAITAFTSTAGYQIHATAAASIAAAANALEGVVYFANPNSTASNKKLWGNVVAGANGAPEFPAGRYTTDVNAINAIRFLPSAGTITSGTIKIYGIKK